MSEVRLSLARDRLLELILERAYREGHFVLRSGVASDYYIDLRVLSLDPEGVSLMADRLLDHYADSGASAVGGPTVSAVPILGAMCARAYVRGMPLRAFFVRDAPKDHGMAQRIEGPPLEPGEKVAIVDDVVSKGGGIQVAIQGARQAGAEIVRVMCVVDREMGGGDLLRSEGYEYHPLYTISDIRAARAQRAPQ